MNITGQRAKYIASDFIAASMVWILFNILRYYQIAFYLGFETLVDYLTFSVVWEVQLTVPFFWLGLHYFPDTTTNLSPSRGLKNYLPLLSCHSQV